MKPAGPPSSTKGLVAIDENLVAPIEPHEDKHADQGSFYVMGLLMLLYMLVWTYGWLTWKEAQRD